MKVEIYSTFVFLHVISAVLSIGPLFVILPLIKKIKKGTIPEESVYLSIIKVIVRIVMHAGHALVVTGVLLILLGPWPWHTSWVIMTIVVMGLSGIFLATAFTRVIRNFDHYGTDKIAVLDRLNQTTWIYIGLMLLLLWLMVQKPNFW